jgi:hypothetical protein
VSLDYFGTDCCLGKPEIGMCPPLLRLLGVQSHWDRVPSGIPPPCFDISIFALQALRESLVGSPLQASLLTSLPCLALSSLCSVRRQREEPSSCLICTFSLVSMLTALSQRIQLSRPLEQRRVALVKFR